MFPGPPKEGDEAWFDTGPNMGRRPRVFHKGWWVINLPAIILETAEGKIGVEDSDEVLATAGTD
jgi:hypothetical protein